MAPDIFIFCVSLHGRFVFGASCKNAKLRAVMVDCNLHWRDACTLAG
jgi:hypothetical protein